MRRPLLLLAVILAGVTLDAQVRGVRLRTKPAPAGGTFATTTIFRSSFPASCTGWTYGNDGGTDAAVCTTGDGISGAENNDGSGLIDTFRTDCNYASGGGGNCFRHIRGYLGDGTNHNGGGIRIAWTSSGEIHGRWYFRWSAGFAWNGGTAQYTKDGFTDQGGNPSIAIGDTSDADCWGGTQLFPVSRNLQGGTGTTCVRWATVGDGNWHYLEWHFKKDTTGSNGVFELWIDGVLSAHFTDVNFAGANTAFMYLANNQAVVDSSVGTTGYTDFDDVAVTAEALRIGPYNAGRGW